MSDPTPAPHRARLRLFGGFALNGPGGAWVAISSRRARGLLSYLLLAPDHGATRERLCGLLWSDRGETQARASLRQCLLELRDNLSGAKLDILDVGRERIALHAALMSSDVSDLRRALAGDDPDVLISMLATLGDGRLLEDIEIGGLFQDWLDQTRPRLEQSIATAVQAQLEKLEGIGDWARVRAMAEGFLRRDPLDEAVVAAAIRADAATGNTSAAHRRFKILQDAMDKEFGAVPGTATRDALAAIGKPSAKLEIEKRVEETGSGPPVARAVGPPLVVVAIFETNHSAEADHKLAATLRDEVVSGLSRFRDLRVITDPRPLDLLGADASAGHAGAYVLGASLRTAAEGSRLIVQLLRLGDRHVVWSERFSVSGLDMVETIDGTIARTVGAVLPTINADILREPSNLPADPMYQRYLLANQAAFSARTFPAARAAADELEAMVAAFPSFALPYLPLAYLYNTDFGCTRALSSGEAERMRALDLAKRALALDRGHSNAYTATGWSYLRRRQWEPARIHFEQALSLNPFHATRVMEVGYGLLFLGEAAKAQTLLDRCLVLNPAPEDGFFCDLGVVAFVHGDHDRAASYFELVANPDTWGLLYTAMNAELGGFASKEGAAAARDRVAKIWPEDIPMEIEAVVAWIASHHPFKVAETEQRFLGAARAMLTRSWTSP
jgi:DNA-binding SARP family transcriptional activator